MSEPFSLRPHQVPEPPKGNRWVDWLRWLVCVMDPDDSSLVFIASILSHAVKGGLTEKQARAANKVMDRVIDRYDAGILECQIPQAAETPSSENPPNVIPFRVAQRCKE